MAADGQRSAGPLRVVISLAAALVGFVAGTTAGGAFLVPPGSGLAGPAIALGWGVVGAAAATVASLLGAGLLSPRGLRRAALLAVAAAAPTLAALVALYLRAEARYYDPAEAYAGLPRYAVSVEQTVVRDPYLATRSEIDTQRRLWAKTLPDGRVCAGNLRAATQARVGALVVALADADLAACRRGAGDADERLEWRLDRDGVVTSGGLDVSPACRAEAPVVARTVTAVKNAGMREESKVDCQ